MEGIPIVDPSQYRPEIQYMMKFSNCLTINPDDFYFDPFVMLDLPEKMNIRRFEIHEAYRIKSNQNRLMIYNSDRARAKIVVSYF